jgi:GT2 family glycosyltransferase
MDISVAILSWNDKQYLEVCLQSLKNGTKSRSMEIIVVDNASTDGSPEMVEALFPDVKLIRNQENLGFPKGNNIGLQASRGRYVYLLNSDIKVFAGCLDVLTDYLDQNPKVGMVGPKILNRDMTHQSSCRRFPTLWNNFCAATGLANIFAGTRFFSGEHMFYFKGDRLMDVDVLVGCFWAVRRAAIDEFGLLDEGFFMFAEDLDWCKRFWEAGWRVVFCPEAQAIHYRGGSSTKKDVVWLALTQQRSILRYWKKHHSAAAVFCIRCLIFIHKISRLGAALIICLINPSERKDGEMRMKVAAACLRDLFSHHNAENIGITTQSDPINVVPHI